MGECGGLTITPKAARVLPRHNAYAGGKAAPFYYRQPKNPGSQFAPLVRTIVSLLQRGYTVFYVGFPAYQV